MNVLEKILAHKREEVLRWREGTPVEELKRIAAERGPAPDFAAALRSKPVGLIAEVKRKSPSAGPIREPFDPVEIAGAYERGGAQALSVLMDEMFFGGGADQFRSVRTAVQVPLLYKEFVVDLWQVRHAASIGASAVLLIVAALSRAELETLMAETLDAGLQPLVEVHDAAETRTAVDAGARLIGINNRNLKTFETTLQITAELRRLVPDDRLLVSESGIRTAEDIRWLRDQGVHAVLVGEHLLRKPDLEAAVRTLMEPAWNLS